MNHHLQTILNFIQQSGHLSAEEKTALSKSAKDADKELEITAFKLERTEKVKHTTAILLEETIEELEQKRKAVETQNRELEIESALERVRTVAMSMNKRDDMLHVCRVISEQLQHLGVPEIRNVQTAIFYETKGTYVNYEFYTKHDKTIITEVEYKNHAVQSGFADQMLKGPNEIFIHSFKGKEVQDWYEFQKTTNVFLDTYLETVSSLNYYWYSLGPVALGFSTYEALNEEGTNLFMRFVKVFELSYRRYLDIEKAETQAREAQIQLALERVRARTMAMQKSNELSETVFILFQQFKELGENPDQATIGVINEDEKVIEYWVTMYGQPINKVFKFSFDEPNVTNKIYTAWKENKKSLVIDLSGNALSEFMTYRANKGGAAINPNEKRRVINVAFFSRGLLNVQFNKERSQESIKLLERFASVFEQTYIRFLDLQNAEEQTRDAQIELALERVRARTMAMQKSDELAETSFVLFQQFKDLGETSEQISIGIFNEDQHVMELYSTLNGSQWKDAVKVDLDEPVVMKKIYKAWREQKKSLVIDLSGNRLREYNAYRTKLSNLEYRKDRWVIHIAFFSKGVLTFSTADPHSHETIQLLGRFAGVFGGTYTRFLDLQKAEAQARESQIQLALERVRARTMAMQHSDELKDAAALLFKQVKALGVPAYSCGYNIWGKNEKTFTSWMSTQDGSIVDGVPNIPLTEDANFMRYVESKQKGEQFFILELRGERMQEHYQYLKTIPAFKGYFDYAVSVGFDLPETQIHHLANFSQGNLLFITLEPCPEFHDVFKRFAAVFEQTYTRFLDLQKAEAQARESQIELGLERVRARAMAMQKSGELSELVDTVFKELTKLDFALTWCIINIIDESSMSNTVWAANPDINKAPESYHMLFEDYPFHDAMMKGWKERKIKYVYTLEGSEKKIYDDYLFSETEFKRTPEAAQAASRAMEKYVVSFSFSNFGGLQTVGNEPLSDANLDILARFGKVFDLTYTRFNDLQKAEAQAREAQIEAALERVRSRSIGMQKSNELKEVIQVVYDQFVHLNIHIEHTGFLMDYKERDDMHIWLADEHLAPSEVTIPWFDSAPNNSIKEAKEKGKDFFTYHLTFEEKNKFYQDLFKFIPGVPDETLEYYINCPGLAGSGVLLENIGLYIENFSGILYTDEENNTLMRFGKVFQQTYTRFLDLQKAEAQAREARIEAALERVRSKTMGMHQSKDLFDVITTIGEQLQQLGFLFNAANFATEFNENGYNLWLATPQHFFTERIFVPRLVNKQYHMLDEAIKQGQDFYSYILTPEEKNTFFLHFFENTTAKNTPEDIKKTVLDAPGMAASVAILEKIILTVLNLQAIPYTDEENNIIKRFAKVFEQSYIRFLDLEKAEAQAREAQIELSLERVRAKTMAMHNSADVGKTAAVMVEELKKLGIATIRFGIGIMHEPGDMEVWTISTDENKTEIIVGWLDMNIHPLLRSAFESWRNKNKSHSYELKGDVLLNYFNAINNYPGYPVKYDIASLPRQIHQYEFYFPEGILFAFSLEQLGEEQRKIFKRFAGVFGQTYRRYLDLKKAEAQAREAQIEAALERVRSRTMAMQNSDELAELVATVFTELNRLDFALTSCIIWINNPELLTAEMWVASTELNKPPEPYYIKPFRHPYFKSVVDAFKKKNKNWVYEMKGEEKKVFQEQFFNEVGSFPTLIKKALEAPESVVYSASFYNFGALEIVGSEHLTDEKFDILHRLGKVFDMSYTRFNDLKQAEAQAKEARIEAALERVRSRTLAMQKSDELAETAAVLFRQLIDLGIAPNRLYIGIINDDTGDIEAWATDEEGGKVNSRFTLSSSRNASIKKMYDGWKLREKSITIDMEGEELADYIAYISGEIHVPVTVGHTQQRRLQNIAYFGKGLIGIASPDPQPQETIQLIERFAAVFNLTYTRFNDLKIAEAHAIQAEEDLIKLQTEKKRAEDALTELRATQAQLIQSEKMASLGELTAGIAHEIQNPLNFVNNFSEVNKELLAEMNEEIEKGNFEEAKLLAKDVTGNEEKINHHGKRADAIVKGMLQHSRSSTGAKEPTDINALADEYLRLTYHGLRAKDKSFNATVKTDFEPGLKKVNIIPQDIGRVILNLITNAFYAVTEKKNARTGPEGQPYEPTVTVSTKQNDGAVEITVADNGGGIPQKVLDKIFQPFFTTKPTGQGTGLGLSLSYDIIKAHGGEIKVETKESEGTEFIIQLLTT